MIVDTNQIGQVRGAGEKLSDSPMCRCKYTRTIWRGKVLAVLFQKKILLNIERVVKINLIRDFSQKSQKICVLKNDKKKFQNRKYLEINNDKPTSFFIRTCVSYLLEFRLKQSKIKLIIKIQCIFMIKFFEIFFL